MFPDNVAYALGGSSSFKYFYLQVHYENNDLDASKLFKSNFKISYLNRIELEKKIIKLKIFRCYG